MKTKTLALLLALVLILTACTSPPAETTTPPTTAPTETVPADPVAFAGRTMRIGNITFMLPDSMSIYEQTDESVILYSTQYRCTMGFFVWDVSEYDEAEAKATVDKLRSSMGGEATEVNVGGRDLLGTIEVTLDENMEPVTTVGTAFTDSWFAYQIQTNYLSGSEDSDAMSETVAMLYNAKIAEVGSRFDFVQ